MAGTAGAMMTTTRPDKWALQLVRAPDHDGAGLGEAFDLPSGLRHDFEFIRKLCRAHRPGDGSGLGHLLREHGGHG
jgi:hypothetical protein